MLGAIPVFSKIKAFRWFLTTKLVGHKASIAGYDEDEILSDETSLTLLDGPRWGKCTSG